MALTKKNISNTLAKTINVSRVEALQITNYFFNHIKQTLAAGEQVKLSGFGNFVIRYKVARPGRNPKTGEKVKIPAKKVVSFKPGPKLKTAVKQKN